MLDQAIAKNQSGELEKGHVTDLAVDSVNHLPAFALNKQRETIKRDLQATIDDLKPQEPIV